MTKLIICSDSHGAVGNLEKIFKEEKGMDAVIYLGDGLRDYDRASPFARRARLYGVAGNCDNNVLEPSEGLIAFDGVLFFYTHGHHYGVKYGMDTITQAALDRGADVALFGHTHHPLCEERAGVLLFNPGSCGRAYSGPDTYGIIMVDHGKIVSAEHKFVPGETEAAN